MPGEQGTQEQQQQQRKTGDIWRKGDAMPYCTGMGCFVVVYVGALLGCIIAGGTAPELFISKQAVLSPPGGVSSASSNLVFDMSGYKVICHPERCAEKGTTSAVPLAFNRLMLGVYDSKQTFVLCSSSTRLVLLLLCVTLLML